MNKNILITFSIIAVAAMLGGFFLSSSSNKSPKMAADPTAVIDETYSESTDVMVKDDVMAQDSEAAGQYVTYTADYLSKYQGKTKVLFFHASWCPVCKTADKDIKDNLANIPGDTIIIKTDYDKEGDLKKKYAITYQHTFVIVDGQGNEVTKWNGGDFNEILRRL
ncbi:MAG: thioredoxin family protein [Candidatus Pacebacteria bacterium]|nr:thioredoxin family protein [Candidatus Paceibacterota bacterium]